MTPSSLPPIIASLIGLIGLMGFSLTSIEAESATATHTKVYFEKGRYGGWPANHGVWSWGNEILVGFTSGVYQDRGPYHHINTEKPVRHLQARSLDGGLTWSVEDPNAKGQLLPEGDSLHGTEIPDVPLKPWRPSPENIRFEHPDFAMTLRLNNIHTGPSRFYLSYNRGKDWDGPFGIPPLNQLKIAARTDYLVESNHECLVFLTAAKSNGSEGRPFMARISEPAATWEFVSWLGPESDGFEIMPSTVRIGPTELYTVVRSRQGEQRSLNAYRSTDNGITWQAGPAPCSDLGAGNPPSLVKLPDGRLCVTYGVRAEPYRICARLSRNHGSTWSDEIILRADGSSADVGYPRSVVRSDGQVVTVYYFSDATTGPERYIGSTLWTPPLLQ